MQVMMKQSCFRLAAAVCMRQRLSRADKQRVWPRCRLRCHGRCGPARAGLQQQGRLAQSFLVRPRKDGDREG